MNTMKDISEIPKGHYCYTGLGWENGKLKVKRCPYWSKRPDQPEQRDGYCAYLEKGDWEYKVPENSPIPASAFSLLWDSVKDPDCPVKEG